MILSINGDKSESVEYQYKEMKERKSLPMFRCVIQGGFDLIKVRSHTRYYYGNECCDCLVCENCWTIECESLLKRVPKLQSNVILTFATWMLEMLQTSFKSI